jgi:hypothetical protein
MEKLAPLFNRLANEVLLRIANDKELKEVSTIYQYNAFRYIATAILMFCITSIDSLDDRLHACEEIIESIADNFNFNLQVNNITGKTH